MSEEAPVAVANANTLELHALCQACLSFKQNRLPALQHSWTHFHIMYVHFMLSLRFPWLKNLVQKTSSLS